MLISRNSGNTDISFNVNTTGILHGSGVITAFYAARPVFYLNSSVAYDSGIGTIDSPIRLSA